MYVMCGRMAVSSAAWAWRRTVVRWRRQRCGRDECSLGRCHASIGGHSWHVRLVGRWRWHYAGRVPAAVPRVDDEQQCGFHAPRQRCLAVERSEAEWPFPRLVLFAAAVPMILPHYAPSCRHIRGGQLITTSLCCRMTRFTLLLTSCPARRAPLRWLGQPETDQLEDARSSDGLQIVRVLLSLHLLAAVPLQPVGWRQPLPVEHALAAVQSDDAVDVQPLGAGTRQLGRHSIQSTLPLDHIALRVPLGRLGGAGTHRMPATAGAAADGGTGDGSTISAS